MIAGSYDYIETCREDYGDEYVDGLLDAGYEPVMVQGTGWRWVLKSEERARRVFRNLA